MLGPAWEEHDSGLQDRGGCSLFFVKFKKPAVDRRSTPSLGFTSGGGPTRTSADVSVPRLAGFSLITCK